MAGEFDAANPATWTRWQREQMDAWRRRHDRDRHEYRIAEWVARQELSREWVSFADIADWCARKPGGVKRDGDRRAQAFRDLGQSVITGEFSRAGRWYVVRPPDGPTPLSEPLRLRVTLAWLRRWPAFHGGMTIPDQELARWWVPRDLSTAWFERRQIALPPWLFVWNGHRAAPVDPLPAGRRQHSRARMAVIGSGVAGWMPLLDAIGHIQAVSGRSVENAAAVVIEALQSGVIPSRRSGPEGAMPLDGRYERWNGELPPQAWHLGTIHDDGTVSFDTSEGSPQFRRTLQHAIRVRHEIEVGRDAVLGLSSAIAGDSKLPPVPAGPRAATIAPAVPKNARRGPSPTGPRIVAVAQALLAAGKVPGKTISWKKFRSEVCRGLKVPENQRGFSLESIQNAVRPLLKANQEGDNTESTER
jgi:hypothetical protein